MIYTTNMIESFHSQLRKVTKSKRVFSSDMALLKLLFLVHHNINGRWKTQILGWKQLFAQMQILFEERINKH
jgi:transposase-like protein